jgi:DNA-binding NtrC family response regulator
MGDSRSAALFAALRTAFPRDEIRHLIALADPALRRRVVAALGGGVEIVELDSPEEVPARLRNETFDLVIIDGDPRTAGQVAPTGDLLERVFDLVLVMDADPAACAAAFAAGAVAVLPRPLPPSDALLRAHLRWLASCKQARRRGALARGLSARLGVELTDAAPALGRALAEIEQIQAAETTVMTAGAWPGPADASGAAAALGKLRRAEASPDVVVLTLRSDEHIEARLREVRAESSGAAVVLIDVAPSPERVASALYGGARATLLVENPERVEEIVARIAVRRKAEIAGRKLIETLARFGVMGDVAGKGDVGEPRDVDTNLINEVATASAPFVPSGHEVLVVDDEPVVLTVLREALRRGGYRVTTAASAEEAIALFDKQAFDLVLTDKNLPGASGLEVLRVARKLQPPPAVVLITGYSSYDSAVEAFDVGAFDYIEKPIKDLESLRQRVRRALSRRDEQMARKESEAAPSANARRVLLVDVAGHRRELMAEFLGKMYRVTTVADGDKALERLEAERFDVVLADRNLPGLSGLRVIEQARRLLPHCAAVLYTAYPSYETVKEAFALGVDAFCVRPSEDLKALGEKVAGALRGRGGILLG